MYAHPMANGQVERFNWDMRKYLITMLEDTTNWGAFLKPLQFAHNTAVSKSTHFTPHYLTFLDDPRLPDSISEQNNCGSGYRTHSGYPDTQFIFISINAFTLLKFIVSFINHCLSYAFWICACCAVIDKSKHKHRLLSIAWCCCIQMHSKIC